MQRRGADGRCSPWRQPAGVNKSPPEHAVSETKATPNEHSNDIPNLYVFGGNAFPSTGGKHPALTMMALSARGCDNLIQQAKGIRV